MIFIFFPPLVSTVITHFSKVIFKKIIQAQRLQECLRPDSIHSNSINGNINVFTVLGLRNIFSHFSWLNRFLLFSWNECH